MVFIIYRVLADIKIFPHSKKIKYSCKIQKCLSPCQKSPIWSLVELTPYCTFDFHWIDEDETKWIFFAFFQGTVILQTLDSIMIYQYIFLFLFVRLSETLYGLVDWWGCFTYSISFRCCHLKCLCWLHIVTVL